MIRAGAEARRDRSRRGRPAARRRELRRSRRPTLPCSSSRAGRRGYARRSRGARDAGRARRRRRHADARSCSGLAPIPGRARHDRGGAQHLPRGEPRRRPGDAHHAGALAHPARQEGAGALQRSSPAATIISSPSSRNAAGEFVASKSPAIGEEIANAALGDNDRASTSSVYASVYYAGLLQDVPVGRHHEGDEDPRVADGFPAAPAPRRCGRVLLRHEGRRRSPKLRPASSSYTSITSGGETYRFYRFRTPDGVVDYYDEKGNNSKQFLMRRPVRGDVRLASGFGMRFHPLLERAAHAHRRRLGDVARHADPRRRHRRHRGGWTQGPVRQLRPHPPPQRLSHRLRPHAALPQGRAGRRQGAAGRDHRLRRRHRPRVRPAPALRGADQLALRRSAGDPGAARARAAAARSSPSSRRSARASTTCATSRRS